MKIAHFLPSHILMGSNLIHFFRVVLQLNFSMKGSIVMRLLTSFFILLLFTPFRIIESILYFFSKKVEVKQPIFIVGHFRSGTTFFHDALNELDTLVAPRMVDCLFPHLNKYFHFMLVPILKKALPETRLMDKMKVRWYSPQEEEFALSLMTFNTSVSFLFAPKNNSKKINVSVVLNDERVKAKWLKAHLKFGMKLQSINKGKTLVFKSPSNTARIKEILEIYPDAKFIHIARNPIDVIPSTINLYHKLLPEFSLQDASNVDITEYVFEFYEQVMQKYFEMKRTLYPTQLFELKYEDFVEQPIEMLDKAFNQLQVSAAVNELEPFFRSRKKFNKNKFTLEEGLKKTIEKRCASVFKEYNYSAYNK